MNTDILLEIAKKDIVCWYKLKIVSKAFNKFADSYYGYAIYQSMGFKINLGVRCGIFEYFLRCDLNKLFGNTLIDIYINKCIARVEVKIKCDDLITYNSQDIITSFTGHKKIFQKYTLPYDADNGIYTLIYQSIFLVNKDNNSKIKTITENYCVDHEKYDLLLTYAVNHEKYKELINHKLANCEFI
jgi:hypothetical protein